MCHSSARSRVPILQKGISIIISLVLLLLITASSANADEIRFLDIPWLSNIQDVKAVIKSKLTKDIPDGEFEVSSWTVLNYKGDEYAVANVPMYTLTYSGRYYYQVAGLNVQSIDLEFVPCGANGTYSDKNTDEYELTLARYSFDKDNVNSLNDVYNQLEKKMRLLYGEPVDTLDDNYISAVFTSKTKGLVWEGEDNTIAELRYSNGYTKYTGTVEGVFITYAYTDKTLFEDKASLILVSTGDGNMDVGQTDG